MSPSQPISQEEKLAKTARTNKIRLLVDLIMIITATLLMLTTIVKFPIPENWFMYLDEKGIFEKISFTFLSYVHDFGGIIFLVALVVHLILNKNRLTWLIRAALKKGSKP